MPSRTTSSALYDPKLDTFLCIVRKGSFAKAAEALYITSTSVILQMNSLEKQLGATLFRRTPRGVSLTRQGEILAREAPKFVSETERIADSVKAAGSKTDYVIRMGTSLLQPYQEFMRLWRAISAASPVRFGLRTVPFNDDEPAKREVLASLGDKIDVIYALEGPFWQKRCNMLPIKRERLCLLMPERDPLSTRSEIKVQELEGRTVMVLPKGNHPAYDRARETLAACENIKIVDSPDTMGISSLDECEANNISLISCECWEDAHPYMHAVRVTGWDSGLFHCIMYSKHPKENVRRFIEALLTARSVGALPHPKDGAYV